MKKLVKFIFSRKFIIVALLLAQIALMVLSLVKLSEHYALVYGFLTVFGFALVCYILNRNESPDYKLAWIVPLLIFPVFSAAMYVFFKAQIGTQLFRKNHLRKTAETRPFLMPDDTFMRTLAADSPEMRNLASYIWRHAGFPAYQNTTVEYFPLGEQKFVTLKRELAAAEHFIFLEYFIIAEGKMWGDILEILTEKAAQGVDVRVLYDGFGSQMHLPDKYDRFLNSLGIKCKVFSPFKPFLSTSQNNRDHRKICVIDGHTAFNGGVNLADEYINRVNRFGHWKDTSVMLKGEAVFSFTMMFLQMWELTEIVSEDYDALRPHVHHKEAFPTDGVIIPFADAPVDDETVGKLVYLDLINRAQEYLFITTPYLILDSDMITSLTYAAKSGVDVRIIIPGKPDKWYVHAIGKSFHKLLIQSGVKLYQYEDGFVHAKNFVSDDTKAIVGTINLDFRSLYLHFECATVMYKSICVDAVKQDFLEMLTKCRRITLDDCNRRSLPDKLTSSVLRIFAPLL
ncbi:MAG: cardiolipin synthase [Oscillospiraceae bacterium]